MKVCPKCNNERNEDQFYASLTYCKPCRSDYVRQRRIEKPEMYDKYYQKYQSQNSDKINERKRAKYLINREAILIRSKKWKELNKDKIKIAAQKYFQKTKDDPHLKSVRQGCHRRHTHTEKYRIKTNKDRMERRKTDPNYRLRMCLSNRIRNALVRGSKSMSSERLLGCSFSQLRTQLESQFLPGMSWENYGKWHIDHIRPCSSFDLSQESEQRKCFHYTNLQPLWAVENLKKGSKLSQD